MPHHRIPTDSNSNLYFPYKTTRSLLGMGSMPLHMAHGGAMGADAGSSKRKQGPKTWTKEEDQLWDAARDGKDGEIERLIDAGTHVDCANPDRVRSPHLTSPHLPPPPPPPPRLLLPSPHSSCSPQNGTTPLMTAARYANLSSVKLLVRYGADVNMKSRWGRTALDDARKYNKQPRIMDKRDVVAFLEDAGQVAAERAKGAAEKEAKVGELHQLNERRK